MGEFKMMQVSHEGKSLASYIDHTLLRADAVARDIETLCTEAHKYGFFGVCVNNSWVPFAVRLLSGTEVTVVSVAGFPLGASSIESKCFETGYAFDHGAREIDVVLNIGRLKQGDNGYIEEELAEIVQAAGEYPVKVIIETCLLNHEEKICACRLVAGSGARYIKTSTGFGSAGATLEDVRLLHECAGPAVAVKAAGGIRDSQTALAMIEAGAARIGTSSSVKIIGKP